MRRIELAQEVKVDPLFTPEQIAEVKARKPQVIDRLRTVRRNLTERNNQQFLQPKVAWRILYK